MRAFVAIDPPYPAAEALSRLREILPVGRPVPMENLHLTLAFLGDQPDDLMEETHYRLQSVAAPEFDLTLAGLDVFGKDAPTLIYAGVEKNPALEHLQKAVRSALRGAGMQLGRQRFRPHVTLARFQRGLPPSDIERLRRVLAERANFRLPPFPVRAYSLYRSTLRPDGAVHEKLADYPLR